MAVKLGAGVSTFRPVLYFARFMQWASAVIVMGIASAYIHRYNPEGEHIIYAEVIATTATVFYLFPIAALFMKSITWQALPLDLIYSYLWLTAAIFEAQDYNYLDCTASDPNSSVSGTSSCSLKYALEAFAFLAFFFTVFAMVIQTHVWHSTSLSMTTGNHYDKEGVRTGADSAAMP